MLSAKREIFHVTFKPKFVVYASQSKISWRLKWHFGYILDTWCSWKKKQKQKQKQLFQEAWNENAIWEKYWNFKMFTHTKFIAAHRKKQCKCHVGNEQHVFGTTLSKIINNSYSQKKQKFTSLTGLWSRTLSWALHAKHKCIHMQKKAHCIACDDLNRSFFLRFFPLIFCLACFKCWYLGNSLYFLLYEISF